MGRVGTLRPGRALPVPGPYRDHRTDVALEVVRAVVALFSVVSLSAAPALPASVARSAVLAHLAVIAVSIVVVATLPLAVRAGRARAVGLAATLSTIAFYAGTSALWHEHPGAGTALGVVALLEAPLRYGVRGAALSGFPVLWTALLLPQVDATGGRLSEGVTVSLVVLLLAAVLTVREVMRRSIAAATGAAQGFAAAMLHLPLGVAVVDDEGRVVQANPALSALLGPVAEGDRLHAHVSTSQGDRLARVLTGAEPDERVVCRTADGREVALGAAVVRLPGPQRTVVHVQDVTDERRERASLLHASRHDALTGLLTRKAGTELLGDALRAGTPVGVLFLDLDRFKQLNDTSGHAVGDLVLRQVAARLAGALRPTEHAVRWGGDEFVVVCSAVSDDDGLHAVGERLLQVLREPFAVPDALVLRLSASVGGVRADAGWSTSDVLAVADAAMYDAKRAGGDRLVVASVSVPQPRVDGQSRRSVGA